MSECEWVSYRIGELISLDAEVDQQISSSPFIPGEFFEDTESTWKGRVKRKHMKDLYKEVEEAAGSLHCAVGFYSSLLTMLIYLVWSLVLLCFL